MDNVTSFKEDFSDYYKTIGWSTHIFDMGAAFLIGYLIWHLTGNFLYAFSGAAASGTAMVGLNAGFVCLSVIMKRLAVTRQWGAVKYLCLFTFFLLVFMVSLAIVVLFFGLVFGPS